MKLQYPGKHEVGTSMRNYELAIIRGNSSTPGSGAIIMEIKVFFLLLPVMYLKKISELITN